MIKSIMHAFRPTRRDFSGIELLIAMPWLYGCLLLLLTGGWSYAT